MEETNFILLSKRTLYNAANKLYTMERTNITQWRKQTLQNGVNKIYTMEQTKFTQWSKEKETLHKGANLFTQ